jgi:myosin heavy subunit
VYDTMADSFLTEAKEATEDSLVQLLQQRYDRGDMYANIGPYIMVAMNPHAPSAHKEDQATAEMEKDASDNLYLQRPAHPFAIALSAYRHMMDNEQHQAVIFT